LGNIAVVQLQTTIVIKIAKGGDFTANRTYSIMLLPQVPPSNYDTCKLREYMAGDEYLAYRDLSQAEPILSEEGNNGALRQRRNIGRRGGGETFGLPG
jgi:hypothetical protein